MLDNGREIELLVLVVLVRDRRHACVDAVVDPQLDLPLQINWHPVVVVLFQ
jgi:hypothetical protein